MEEKYIKNNEEDVSMSELIEAIRSLKKDEKTYANEEDTIEVDGVEYTIAEAKEMYNRAKESQAKVMNNSSSKKVQYFQNNKDVISHVISPTTQKTKTTTTKLKYCI